MISHNSILKRTLPMLMQCAEAHRKPRWLPVAKSKIFRIPKRPVISEEERIELLRINNNYKTQMRAIKRFYHEEMIKEKSTLESASSEMSQQLEAEEWERCVKINDTWNAQIAAEREERRKKELQEMEEFALARMEAKDKELRHRIAKASEEIREQKKLSSTFITPENLEEAIDKALANPVDYNFAIDLQGQQYLGRDTPIPTKEQKKAASNN
ncbi:PREDICTED: probable 28S ribosomal protein S26, mitochondrial [Papilio xuthus]|uniref:Small ribosomal subunit protein mS26 n=1 Tax=Papilio xuthus TaxID=66420 RepID=A0AAJ7EDS1_PAPXU|nr:PREDICTED: probable 28S ribosomal protein S26, mitochondrial [Papilio xuthus]